MIIIVIIIITIIILSTIIIIRIIIIIIIISFHIFKYILSAYRKINRANFSEIIFLIFKYY